MYRSQILSSGPVVRSAPKFFIRPKGNKTILGAAPPGVTRGGAMFVQVGQRVMRYGMMGDIIDGKKITEDLCLILIKC